MSDDKEIKLHSGDKSLIEAAQTGKGAIPLTADMVDGIKKSLDERTADIEERYPELVEKCDPETRLAIVAWVMHHICDHAKEGGTFRYLIYERLGFGPEAYVPLYLAGGMTISNEFDLSGDKEKTNEGD